MNHTNPPRSRTRRRSITGLNALGLATAALVIGALPQPVAAHDCQGTFGAAPVIGECGTCLDGKHNHRGLISCKSTPIGILGLIETPNQQAK